MSSMPHKKRADKHGVMSFMTDLVQSVFAPIQHLFTAVHEEAGNASISFGSEINHATEEDNEVIVLEQPPKPSSNTSPKKRKTDP